MLKGCRMGLRRPSPIFFFVACGLSRDICNSEKEREREATGVVLWEQPGATVEIESRAKCMTCPTQHHTQCHTF